MSEPARTVPSDWNRQIIEEFRANEGRVGGRFEGAPVLLLTTKGAKTGRLHTTPMMYLRDGDRYVVFASYAGGPRNPDWYYNLKANPDVTVEVGAETFAAHAEITHDDERDALYAEQVRRYPMFGEYQKQTSRVIPVIAISRLHN